MIKQKLIIVFVAVFAIGNSVKAQSYLIKSFEGQNVKIQLTEKTTKNSWNVAKLSCLSDSLFLVDYNGIKEVHVLRDKFLEIIYNAVGGSGYQTRNTMILCVSKNKFNVAILVDSFGKSFGGDVDGSLYLVKFSITGNKKKNFKLAALIYDRHKSRSNPQKNYIKNEHVILNFDSVRNIFYTAHKNIHQSFTINNPKTQKSTEQRISGLFPIIDLSGDNYYYIKNEWYNCGYNHNLYKEYYK